MELIRLAMRLASDGYRVDERLLEVNFGDWQGLTLQEVDAREPGIVAQRDASKWDFRPPGDDAESYATLSSRVTDWLGTVAKPTICVTHGGVLRTLFHTLAGIDGNEAAMLHIPQDRILLLRGDRLEWL
jgi:probable phosphoglycerate mutase